jgi:gamma-butyrobetaine dioxygenase
MAGSDNDHAGRGADWLGLWFGPEVTEPVRLHVAAKRYLCGTDPGYHALLSPASRYTLSVQGGPMGAEEARRFAAGPFAGPAVRVRRWDDHAKQPGVGHEGLGHFLPLLRELDRAGQPAGPRPTYSRRVGARMRMARRGRLGREAGGRNTPSHR